MSKGYIENKVGITGRKSAQVRSGESNEGCLEFFDPSVAENGKEKSDEKKKRLSNNFFLSDLTLDD